MLDTSTSLNLQILRFNFQGAYLVSNIPLPDLKRSDDELGELGFGLQRDLDSEYGDYYSSFELDVSQNESNIMYIYCPS